VCDNSGGATQVVIVDLEKGNDVTKRPISAEAAIMNPVSQVLLSYFFFGAGLLGGWVA
jgi:clathrin heavy chain